MTATSDTPTGLLEAMLAVQAEAPTLPKDATNSFYKSRYTKLETVVETINPLLTKNRLVWTAKPSYNPEFGPSLKYKVAHVPSGESDEGEMPLLLSDQHAQGQGSALTYARRYAICAVFNLVADDDDDGQRAAEQRQGGYGSQREPAWKSEPASKPQVSKLKGLVTQHKLDATVMTALLKGAGVELAEGEKVNDAIGRLTKGQCSMLIDEIQAGAIRTGESDVPAPADGEFVHPPEPEDQTRMLEGAEPS